MIGLKQIGAACLVILAAGLAIWGQPDADRWFRWHGEMYEAQLAGREVQIDPAELLEIRYNRALRLFMFDVRPETDYNRFHIVGSQRLSPEHMTPDWAASIPDDAVKVVISNDEAAATQAWRRLAGLRMANVYILAGGINLWLDIYKDQQAGATPPVPPAAADTLRHPFSMSLCDCFGTYYDYGSPKQHDVAHRDFAKKVKLKVVAPPTGGCGG